MNKCAISCVFISTMVIIFGGLIYVAIYEVVTNCNIKCEEYDCQIEKNYIQKSCYDCKYIPTLDMCIGDDIVKQICFHATYTYIWENCSEKITFYSKTNITKEQGFKCIVNNGKCKLMNNNIEECESIKKHCPGVIVVSIIMLIFGVLGMFALIFTYIKIKKQEQEQEQEQEIY